MVGGIGIPVNDVALYLFMQLFGLLVFMPHVARYPIADCLAFEVSTTINFVLNQLFTYNDQKLGTLGAWVKRAAKAQMTSLSSMALSYGLSLLFTYVIHLNMYIASPLSIICAFTYNYFVSRKFVFRATTPKSDVPAALDKSVVAVGQSEEVC
jgi:putative flippase GtrA